MRATRFEFRFRFAVHVVLFALGFTAPWNYALHLDHGKTLWEWLSITLFLCGWMQFQAASVLLLIVATLFAIAAAFLRTWAAAYLGSGVVQSMDMHGSTVVADGPYRHLRNPLYVGLFLHACALALLMPPSGAAFALIAIGLFQLRLIFAEEYFLSAKLGERYLAYCARVPRLFPSAAPRVPAGGMQPLWVQGALGEIYMIGVPLSFAVFGWRYSAFLLIKCVLISLGVSLIVRAAMPPAQQTA